MERQMRTISYGLEPPWTTGMFLRLWLGDVAFAAEYWAVRGAQAGLAGFRLLVRPAAIVSALLLVGGGGMTAIVHEKLAYAREQTARLDLEALANGVELFQLETGTVPVTLDEMVPKYIRELHRDPWGHNYVLFHGPGGVALVSAGSDGQLGTADDALHVVLPHGFVLRSAGSMLIQPGDRIRAVNGVPVRSPSEFDAAIAGKQPPVEIDVDRHGLHF